MDGKCRSRARLPDHICPGESARHSSKHRASIRCESPRGSDLGSAIDVELRQCKIPTAANNKRSRMEWRPADLGANANEIAVLRGRATHRPESSTQRRADCCSENPECDYQPHPR